MTHSVPTRRSSDRDAIGAGGVNSAGAGSFECRAAVSGAGDMGGTMRSAGSRASMRRQVMTKPAYSSGARDNSRSEEHTSELQSLMRTSYAVFCLKKKQ